MFKPILAQIPYMDHKTYLVRMARSRAEAAPHAPQQRASTGRRLRSCCH